MVIYTENPKEYTLKTPRIITGNQWSCRIQVKAKKTIAFLYTNNELKVRTAYNCSKEMKCLVTGLTKKV